MESSWTQALNECGPREGTGKPSCCIFVRENSLTLNFEKLPGHQLGERTFKPVSKEDARKTTQVESGLRSKL